MAGFGCPPRRRQKQISKNFEKLWAQIESHIPDGPAFGNPPEYDGLCLAFRQILQFLDLRVIFIE
jgi:hypothetical protein